MQIEFCRGNLLENGLFEDLDRRITLQRVLREKDRNVGRWIEVAQYHDQW
jgi:hypothetical protein